MYQEMIHKLSEILTVRKVSIKGSYLPFKLTHFLMINKSTIAHLVNSESFQRIRSLTHFLILEIIPENTKINVDNKMILRHELAT